MLARHRHRILVVEDELLVRMMLTEALTAEGFEVLEAASGDEALEVWRSAPHITLLLTDVQFPGQLNGVGLARLIRQTKPELPTIFMTGRPDAMTGIEQTSRDAFVAKPYLPSEVIAEIRRLTSASV